LEVFKIFKVLIQCIKLRPFFLSIVSYAIGGGFVSYIGIPLNPQIFWLGLIIVVLFSICTDTLTCFFKSRGIETGKNLKELILIKNSLMILSLSLLTLGAILSVRLYSIVNPGLTFWLVLGIFFVILIFSAIPPFSLNEKGYGELFLTFRIVALTPLFASLLQINELHKALFLITFPAFFLVLAYFLAQSLENYYNDVKTQNHTLMTNLGWKLGMKMHNYFLLFTYFLYGIASLLGLSGILSLPAWLSLPVAGIQFWEMWRIGEGYKPRWKLLKISSLGSISVLAYFLLFIFWLR
jgi:1,4-dihydroxy-2-naphthoate octaprenyltransferase